jgi:hypothetical protein
LETLKRTVKVKLFFRLQENFPLPCTGYHCILAVVEGWRLFR